MSVELTINGQVFDYPETGDEEWGPEATDWAVAVSTGLLQKTGGLFQLLSEVDFGAGFGIKSIYFKSRTTNFATTGTLRLAVTDGIYWRNNANNANLGLTLDGADNLLFNGNPFGGVLGVADTDSIDMSLIGGNVSGDLNLSAAVATAGSILVNHTIEADGLKGQWLLSDVPIADTNTTGFLSDTDWDTFNNKQPAGSYQPAGNYITSLTTDVTAAGPGAVAATLAYPAINGKTAETAPASDDEIVMADVSVPALRKITKANFQKLAVRTVSGVGSATINDDVLLMDMTGGAFTLTLPTAVGNTGKVFFIKKIDSSLNIGTIDGDGTETIDGVTTKKLNTQYESWEIVSDGSNWLVLDHKCETPWVTYTMTIGSTGAAPTKGTTSVDRAQWKRDGDDMLVRYEYNQTAAGSAGTGNYRFPIANAATWSIDTAKLTPSTNTYGSGFAGCAEVQENTTENPAVVSAADSTNFLLSKANAINDYVVIGAGNADLGTTTIRYQFIARVPILNWEA